MNFKNLFKRKTEPVAKTATKQQQVNDIAIKIAQEFQDRNRKDIQGWRKSITAAENPEDPRWYILQDLIDDLVLDAHLSSVLDVRKSATLNHRFYIRDKNSKETLEEQTEFLNKQWFFEFLDTALDSVYRKYTVAQFFKMGDNPDFRLVPRRNICPQLGRMYLEVGGNTYVEYRNVPNVIEILHSSKFGLINDVIPNVIWKRNALQSYAEFTEKYGQPLITATTNNKQDIPRIDVALKNLGEASTGVLPHGTTITIHDLANAGNPEKTYIENARFQDNQVSKRIIGSTTIVDEGANRAQTQVHIGTLDDKIALSDKRFVMFCVNDQLFPILQNLGFDFNTETMEFVFDETESMTLTEQWNIAKEAMNYFELDPDELMKTYNLPIIGKKERNQNPLSGFSANFR
jgi:hypothetical protein